MAPFLEAGQEELDRRRASSIPLIDPNPCLQNNTFQIVGFGAENITNTSANDYPSFFPGEGHEWNVQKFKRNFRVQIHESSPREAAFSLVGLDASIANAFRRILIAEVPTLAIENIYIHQNTSIIQDEVLASRLGLIPLKGNKEGLDWMRWKAEGSSFTDYNTVVLHLDVTCTWKEDGKDLFIQNVTDSNLLYNDSHIYPTHFVQELVGRQGDYFSGEDGIEAVNPEILIAKLRPGQVINLTMHCNKGIGADHAKFSPVATASYRLLPKIDIHRPILGQDAKKFARCFPRGVIKLEPVTKEEANEANSEYKGHEGEMKAVVADPMKDTVSRECLRHDEFKDKVKLGRVRDHFIFSIESTGQFESEELFIQSVKLLKAKCQRMKRSIAEIPDEQRK